MKYNKIPPNHKVTRKKWNKNKKKSRIKLFNNKLIQFKKTKTLNKSYLKQIGIRRISSLIQDLH